MAEGWIKLHRNIQEHWLWQDEPYDKARAWIDLLFLANYEDKKTSYKGSVIICKRGDVNLSFSDLAERWHWSRQRVSRFIKLLESDQMVRASVTTRRTVITIVNYDKFQCVSSTDVTNNITDSITDGGQIADTTKEIKKVKKVKNNKYTPPKIVFGEYKHVKLTEDEFVKLGKDYGSARRDEAIKFLDEYIEQKPGYKNESHNLCIRKWVFDAVDEQKRKASKNSFQFETRTNYDMDAIEKLLTGG